MRLHKVVNRIVRGTVYYRWVLNVPPKEIRALGWVDGQQLEAFSRGGTLTLQPARYPVARRAQRATGALREEALTKSPPRFTARGSER